MTKDSTLEQIEIEVKTGELGKARDRLHGLIATYPDDLTLRARLAQVYWTLQYPEMAGRYWLFEAGETDEIRMAQAAFEKRYGRDPLLMLQAIKFRGNPDLLPPPARQRLDRLIAECQDKHEYYPTFAHRQVNWQQTEKGKTQERALLIGLITVVLIVVSCALIGLITVLSWVF